MTWNQIIGKMRCGCEVADILSSKSIGEQIAEFIGYRDEASCEILSFMSLPIRSAENAEYAIRSSLSASRDFHKLRVFCCEKKGQHKAIVSLVGANSSTLHIYTVEITREN